MFVALHHESKETTAVAYVAATGTIEEDFRDFQISWRFERHPETLDLKSSTIHAVAKWLSKHALQLPLV